MADTRSPLNQSEAEKNAAAAVVEEAPVIQPVPQARQHMDIPSHAEVTQGAFVDSDHVTFLVKIPVPSVEEEKKEAASVEQPQKQKKFFKIISSNTLNASGMSGLGAEPLTSDEKENGTGKRIRFDRITTNLATGVQLHEADAICLQETDIELAKELLQQKLPNWTIVTDELGLLTAYSPRYICVQQKAASSPNRTLSLTLQDQQTGHVLDLHNLWGTYTENDKEFDEFEEEYRTLLMKSPTHTAVLVGDTNLRIAPLHNRPENITTGIVPTVFSRRNFDLPEDQQLSDFPDGGFCRLPNGKIKQLEIEQLSFAGAKIIKDQRSIEEVKPHPRKVRVMTLDDEYYGTEKAAFQEFLGQQKPFFRYKVVSTSFNEKETSLILQNKEDYENFKKNFKLGGMEGLTLNDATLTVTMQTEKVEQIIGTLELQQRGKILLINQTLDRYFYFLAAKKPPTLRGFLSDQEIQKRLLNLSKKEQNEYQDIIQKELAVSELRQYVASATTRSQALYRFKQENQQHIDTIKYERSSKRGTLLKGMFTPIAFISGGFKELEQVWKTEEDGWIEEIEKHLPALREAHRTSPQLPLQAADAVQPSNQHNNAAAAEQKDGQPAPSDTLEARFRVILGLQEGSLTIHSNEKNMILTFESKQDYESANSNFTWQDVNCDDRACTITLPLDKITDVLVHLESQQYERASKLQKALTAYETYLAEQNQEAVDPRAQAVAALKGAIADAFSQDNVLEAVSDVFYQHQEQLDIIRQPRKVSFEESGAIPQHALSSYSGRVVGKPISQEQGYIDAIMQCIPAGRRLQPAQQRQLAAS